MLSPVTLIRSRRRKARISSSSFWVRRRGEEEEEEEVEEDEEEEEEEASLSFPSSSSSEEEEEGEGTGAFFLVAFLVSFLLLKSWREEAVAVLAALPFAAAPAAAPFLPFCFFDKLSRTSLCPLPFCLWPLPGNFLLISASSSSSGSSSRARRGLLRFWCCCCCCSTPLPLTGPADRKKSKLAVLDDEVAAGAYEEEGGRRTEGVMEEADGGAPARP